MKPVMIGAALGLACMAGEASAQANGPSQYDTIIAKHASANGVPEALVRRVIVRESRYNPRARNGPYWGMMQISVATARGAGFRGSPTQLLDADINLRYAVRYLAGAYKVAGGDHGRAVGYYARGYYYAAKSKGLLAAIGMSRNGTLTPPKVGAEPEIAVAADSPAPQTPAQRVVWAFGSKAQTPAPAAAQPETAPQAAIPMPPSRGPAAGPTIVAAATPAATAAATPLPTARDAAQPARRTIAPAQPVLAAAIPTPTPREEPTTTASITPRSGARQPIPLPPAAQPAAIASAKPAAPLPPARGQQALAYAGPARALATPPMQPAPAAPLPPRR